jgi:hypothetical protein
VLFGCRVSKSLAPEMGCGASKFRKHLPRKKYVLQFFGAILMDIPERQATNLGLESSTPETDPTHPTLSQTEIEDENRRIRRLQIMMNMVMAVIAQEDMTLEEASEMVANAKRAALAMFPDKELAYDLIYKPRLQRLLRERFRLQ